MITFSLVKKTCFKRLFWFRELTIIVFCVGDFAGAKNEFVHCRNTVICCLQQDLMCWTVTCWQLTSLHTCADDALGQNEEEYFDDSGNSMQRLWERPDISKIKKKVLPLWSWHTEIIQQTILVISVSLRFWKQNKLHVHFIDCWRTFVCVSS